MVGSPLGVPRSPGRLAVYRRKFESAVRRDEEDPSKFATELDTLDVRGFADAGPSARIWMVRDRLVAGHRDCELWRHLDSVPPDTLIQDIVDRCRLWESHSDAHNGYQSSPGIARDPWEVGKTTPNQWTALVMMVRAVYAAATNFGSDWKLW